MTPEWDLAFTAFAWVPLHARHVVQREGFTAFADRPRRLRLFLDSYGWDGQLAEFVSTVQARFTASAEGIQRTAATGDPPTNACSTPASTPHCEQPSSSSKTSAPTSTPDHQLCRDWWAFLWPVRDRIGTRPGRSTVATPAHNASLDHRADCGLFIRVPARIPASRA